MIASTPIPPACCGSTSWTAISSTDFGVTGRAMGPEHVYLQELIDRGLLIPMGVDGVYGRSAVFEDVLDRFGDLVTPWGHENGAEAIRFPPVMNRQHFEQSGYLKNFPHLAGTIHCFHGGEREHLD